MLGGGWDSTSQALITPILSAEYTRWPAKESYARHSTGRVCPVVDPIWTRGDACVVGEDSAVRSLCVGWVRLYEQCGAIGTRTRA